MTQSPVKSLKRKELIALINDWAQGNLNAGARVVLQHFKRAIHHLAHANFSPDKRRFSNQINSLLEAVARIEKKEMFDVFTEYCLYLIDKKSVIFTHIRDTIIKSEREPEGNLEDGEIKSLAFSQLKWLRRAAIDFEKGRIIKAGHVQDAEAEFIDEASISTGGEPQELEIENQGVKIGMDKHDFIVSGQQLSPDYEEKKVREYRAFQALARECLKTIEEKEVKAVLMASWLDYFGFTAEEFRREMPSLDSGFEERLDALNEKIKETHRRKKEEESRYLDVCKISESDMARLFNFNDVTIARNLMKRAKTKFLKWYRGYRLGRETL